MNNRSHFVADFVLPARHEVINWQDVLVLAAVEGDHFVPLSVQILVGGQRVIRWQRDFHKNSVPYLVFVGDQLVIGFVYKGRLVKAIAIEHLRDLDEGVKPPLGLIIDIKEATAKAMDLPVAFDGMEQAFIDGINAAKKAGQVPPLETLATLAIVAEPAAPVKAPQPAPAEAEVAPATNVKAAMVAAEKAKIAGRELVTVYRKDNGAPLTGKKVYSNETKFLVDGDYVTHNKDDVPVDHFTAKADGKGKVHRKDVVLVSVHIPAHISAAEVTASAGATKH